MINIVQKEAVECASNDAMFYRCKVHRFALQIFTLCFIFSKNPNSNVYYELWLYNEGRILFNYQVHFVGS